MQGTGGVAVFAVQFAKAMGATVTVISSSDEKLAKIRDLGADNTVNYREHPQWSDRVNDLLGGESIDLAIEWVGRRHWPNPSTVSGWGASERHRGVVGQRSAGRYL